MLPPFSEATRLMVVAPHPDDETIATGVLIQQVVAAGGEVQVLLLTAGDNNPWPQRWLERRWHIGPVERQRWGRRRHAEILEGLQHLGLSARALRLMGWPDLGVAGRLLSAEDRAAGGNPVEELAEAIARFNPGVLVYPALADRHPDHGTAHVLVQLALAGRAPEHMPRQLAYLVHGRATGTAAHEVSGNALQRRRKLAALSCYHSQMALSGRRLRRLAARAERYVEVSARRPADAGSALPWRPGRWLQRWLRLSVAGRAEAVSWAWRDAPLEPGPGGGHVLASHARLPGGRRFARLSCDLPSLWIFDHWGWREL